MALFYCVTLFKPERKDNTLLDRVWDSLKGLAVKKNRALNFITVGLMVFEAKLKDLSRYKF